MWKNLWFIFPKFLQKDPGPGYQKYSNNFFQLLFWSRNFQCLPQRKFYCISTCNFSKIFVCYVRSSFWGSLAPKIGAFQFQKGRNRPLHNNKINKTWANFRGLSYDCFQFSNRFSKYFVETILWNYDLDWWCLPNLLWSTLTWAK